MNAITRLIVVVILGAGALFCVFKAFAPEPSVKLGAGLLVTVVVAVAVGIILRQGGSSKK